MSKVFGALLVLALIGAACGDDSDDDTSGAEEPGVTTTEAEGEPVVGGEATILQWSESASMDPARAVGSSGTDGMRMFSVYGALVAANPDTGEVERVMAETFEPDAAMTTWTLKLHPGITFTDGTPYNADAVRVNWERIKNPASRSPSLGVAGQIASMTAVDATTLEIKLSAPNGQFDRSVSRNALNYIASPQAIAAGTDLSATPIGAGPFTMRQWLRDDRMVLVKNPDYFDAPKPYLDQLTIRVLGNDEQRVDTFKTGGADGFYVTIDDQIESATADGDGTFYGPQVGTATTLMFNVKAPPFDDIRVRRAITLGIDRDALVEIASPGGEGASNFTPEDSPFYTPDAELPAYDPEEAQRLLDEVNAERGQTLKVTILGTTNTHNTSITNFMQTSLMQLDGIEVDVQRFDSPTFVPRILQGDFQVTTWGMPWTDPEPLLYSNLRGGLPSNLMRYDSATVNTALDEARATTDQDDRAEAYQRMFEALAEDLPFVPNSHANYGYVLSSDLRGAQVYEDGTIRPDLLWWAQ